MGDDRLVDDASEPECRSFGPYVHLQVKEVQLGCQGEGRE